ncbi:hypothetical protein B0J17DRAFT_717579 [Rhizoctonia solani]|nr:hypothetical protein B0J17DRAFT_717579 [Rhizoctonia solani]
MAQGKLWTLAPIIHRKNSEGLTRGAAELSLQHSNGRKPNLAHRERFHTVNIHAENPTLIQQVISLLAVHDVSNSLEELSLCRLPTSPVGHFPQESYFLATTNPTEPNSLNHITRFLQILRVTNIHIHWQHVSLAELLELRVQSVMLAFNSDLYQMFPDNALEISLLSLPNLEALHLGDLCYDALQLILSNLAPSSYQLSLNITAKTFLLNTPGGMIWVGCGTISDIMQTSRIETLMLDWNQLDSDWIDEDFLETILSSFASLTTLKFHNWIFTEAEWVALTSPSPSALTFIP